MSREWQVVSRELKVTRYLPIIFSFYLYCSIFHSNLLLITRYSLLAPCPPSPNLPPTGTLNSCGSELSCKYEIAVHGGVNYNHR